VTPRAKLCIANGLMLAGLAPFALGACWVVAVLSYAQTHKGQMGGGDAIMMMVVLFAGYVFALVVAGGGALWSRAVARRDGAPRSLAAAAIRTLVAVALLPPFIWYLGVTLHIL